MTREELSKMVELLRDTAKIHQPNEEILTDVKAESFIFIMDSVLSALSENKGDLISRQAVLDELEKWDWQDLYLPIHFKQILDDIPSVENKGEWIPVSERLPESSGVYIVSRWFSDGEESAILTDANYYDGCGEWYNDNRINWGRELVTDKIVAWQPLPEPYKAESEDKE